MKKAISIVMILFFVCISAKTEEQQIADVPILMYHAISLNSGSSNYVLSPEKFKADLQYLKENGYTTVTMQDLIGFVKEGIPLPDKPVVITFDDGNVGEYLYVMPLLKEYNMKAVTSIIGEVTDRYSSASNSNTLHPNLMWHQINEMIGSGHFEVQNHSYNMHGKNGSGQNKQETNESFKTRFANDLDKLQQRTFEMTGKKPTTFAYPLGIMAKDANEILKEIGFEASFSSTEGKNILTQGNLDCLFALRRYNRSNMQSAEQILLKYYK